MTKIKAQDDLLVGHFKVLVTYRDPSKPRNEVNAICFDDLDTAQKYKHNHPQFNCFEFFALNKIEG